MTMSNPIIPEPLWGTPSPNIEEYEDIEEDEEE
jgi:hypothetical protein